jgi:hypothetical protein
MFGVIIYIGVAMVVAGILTFLYVVTRSIQTRDEMKSWRIFAFVFIATLVLPYIAIEGMTMKYGDQLKKVTEAAYDDSEAGGELLYHKVFWISEDKAKVMAVGYTELDWGGTERPVVRVNLISDGKKWKADSYEVLISDAQNKDNVVVPPFF